MFEIKPEEDAILDFRKPYTFLSNFSRSELLVDGKPCMTVEHACQMQKTLDPAARESIRLKQNLQWGKESASTKSFPLREGWSEMSLSIMRILLEKSSLITQKLPRNCSKQATGLSQRPIIGTTVDGEFARMTTAFGGARICWEFFL